MSYVFAVHTRGVDVPGGRFVKVQRGEPRYADDPVVVAHPELFSSSPPGLRTTPGWSPGDARVEQATAAPGEKRATRRAG